MPIELIITIILMALSIGMATISEECPMYIVAIMVITLFLLLIVAFDYGEFISHVAN
jgi:hypothetical protein